MVEDVAATVFLAALQLGTPDEIPDDVVERCTDRYTNVYGQRRATRQESQAMRADLATSEVWFVTGSQHLYGPETLATVARAARRRSRRPSTRRRPSRSASSSSPS